MKVDLAGKVALVTGGGRGIGRGIATILSENGAAVHIATRTAASGQAVADELNAAAGNVTVSGLDLSTRAACDQAVADTVGHHGAIDVVVHNSASFAFTPFEALGDDEFDLAQRSIVTATLWLAQAALPHLKARGSGRIILISSPIGNRSHLKGLHAYAAAKAGLNGLAKNLAVEFGPYGTTVNLIEPGLTIDDRDPRMPRDIRDQIVANIPMGREAFPADIAAAALFFASPAAGLITGQYLGVDGGHHLPDMSAYAMAQRV